MKVLIHFAPGLAHDIFLGSRLRKNLKGAMELRHIALVDSLYAEPDVCHLLSPDDLDMVKVAHEEGVPVVVSALYTELDPYASFLETDAFGNMTLTSRGKRMLEEADMVFVPSLRAKEIVEKDLFQKPIHIVSPGVNPVRFDSIDEIGAKIFCRYERFPANQPYVLILGSYREKNAIEFAKSIANMVPNFRFFFLGGDYGSEASPLSRWNRSSPKNLNFIPVLADDLYRSAIKGAIGLLVAADALPSPLSELEALAAKTQIFYVDSSTTSSNWLPEDAYLSCHSVEEAATKLLAYSPNVPEATIMNGYRVAEENDLTHLGEAVLPLYQALLSAKENSHD